jgi:hypothetical protein
MTPEEKHAREKAYALGWIRTGELLEAFRREDVRNIDTKLSIQQLDDAFESEMWLRPDPRPTSGMVEMQRVLARARK